MSLCKLMDDASIAHTNAIIEFEFYYFFFWKLMQFILVPILHTTTQTFTGPKTS